ncbi:hypothetical protein T484DRAFT_1765617 [Baffinella frigidus]|nr:hypothetical protein T484DRAFT_1765617 [Cryptophyta sp. CCMP2293]
MPRERHRTRCRHCSAFKKGTERWYKVDPFDPAPAVVGREGCWDQCPTHKRDWDRRKNAAAEALVSPAASGAAHRPALAPLPVSEPLFAPSSAQPLAALQVPEALFYPPPLPLGSLAAGQPPGRAASEELRKIQAAARLLQAADIGSKVLDSKMLDSCTIEELLKDAEFGRRVKAADGFLLRDGVLTEHDKKWFNNIRVFEMLVRALEEFACPIP